MDEKYIEDLYNQLGGQGKFGALQDFKDMIKNDPNYRKDFYDAFGEQTLGKFEDFSSLVSSPEVKKKDQGTTVSSLVPTSSVTGGKVDETYGVPFTEWKQEKPKDYIKETLIKQNQKDLESVQGSKDFLKSLNSINADLISGTEENVVPMLNFQFGDAGFKFEESGATGDWMKVKSPDGEEIEISLDNFFSDKDLAESNRLKQFIVSKGQKAIPTFKPKYTSEQEIENSVKSLNDDLNSLVEERDAIIGENEKVDDLLSKLNSTPENLRDDAWTDAYTKANDQKSQLMTRANNLESKRNDVESRQARIQTDAGSYMSMKSEQGTWYGNKWNQVLGAVGKMYSGFKDIQYSFDETGGKKRLLNYLAYDDNKHPEENAEEYKKRFIETASQQGILVPESATGSMDGFQSWVNSISLGKERKDEIDNIIANKAEGEFKAKKSDENKNILIDLIGDPNTTKQYDIASRENFWGGVIGGLIDFAPAMIGPTWQKALKMYAISNDGMKDALNENPETKNMSEEDKMLIATPFNLVNSVLLEFGLNKIMANKSLVTNIAYNALKLTAKDATVYEFKNIIKGEVNNAIARGAINVTKSTLAGAELGTALYGADVSLKQLFNESSGKDMFKTPEGVFEGVKEAATSALHMAAGGLLLGVPGALRSAVTKGGYRGMSDDVFELFEGAANDPDVQKFFVSDLKNKVASGVITSEQAKETLNNFRNSVGLFKSLPEGLELKDKKEAMDLLKRKKELENMVKDKDPALVKPLQNKIDLINEQLTKLSEDAIQKQEADAGVLRTAESELGLSEMGKGDTELKITTEQEKLITDEEQRRKEELSDEDMADIASAYLADPIKYTEQEIEFWTEEVKIDPESQPILDRKIKLLEALKVQAGEEVPRVEAGAEKPVGETTAKPEGQEATGGVPAGPEGVGRGGAAAAEPMVEKTGEVKVGDNVVTTRNFDGKPVEVKGQVEKVNVDADGYTTYELKLEDGTKFGTDEVTKTEAEKTAFEEARDAAKKIKEQLRSMGQGLGVNQQARLEVLVKYHKALVNQAKEFIKEKAGDITEWAKSIGENINESIQKAWDEATGKISPIEKGEDLGYDMETIFGKEVAKLPGYEKTMEDVQFLAEDALKSRNFLEEKLNNAKKRLEEHKNKEGYDPKSAQTKKLREKVSLAKAELQEYQDKNYEEAVAKLQESDLYKSASDTQREDLIRDLRSRFEFGEKKAPSAEKITGKAPEEMVTMTTAQALKEQIKSFASGVKEGVKTVKEAKKAFIDFVTKNENKLSLSRKELLKVIDLMRGINDEKGLNDAIEKASDIIVNANKDLIEVSKTKIDKQKMKAELSNLKKGAKSVTDRLKEIKRYFDSVKEYGNLTRKDLQKIMTEISKVKNEETLDKAVDKINDIIDNAKTDVVEMSAMRILRDKMNAIKKAKKDLNEKRKLIAEAIDFIKKSGSIDSKKAGILLKKIGKVNLENDLAIEKVIEYAEKLFEDAEYDNKLSNANSTRLSIKRLASGKNKDANLVAFAKKFMKIKPSDVENIDEYNKMASELKESLQGSKKTSDSSNPLKIAEMINIKVANEYADRELESQRNKIEGRLIEWARNILGVDETMMTDDEVLDLVKSGQVSEQARKGVDETIIRDAIKRAFDTSASIIDYILENGRDPFTGEDIDIPSNRKGIVRRFMEMDLSLLDEKSAIQAIDALNNFIQNGSIANMENVLSEYTSTQNSNKAINMGLTSIPLKLFFSPGAGRWFGEQISTLTNLTETMFKGATKSATFRKLSGITSMINAKAFVQRSVNDLTSSYYKEFKKSKPNGEDFFDQSNISERGIVAAVMRTVIGTPEQQQAEFGRKKGLIEKGIDLLKTGTEKERELAKIYEKAYDKVLKDSENVNDVLDKADANNISAVEWWIDKWSDIYQDLADVSESIYNKVLDKDLGYTPDRFKMLSEAGAPADLLTTESIFHGNGNNVYKKKTGVLEESKRPSGEEIKDRYLNLSFDMNMANSYYDAMMDIHTSAAVRQIESFFKNENIKKIIPSADDRRILYNKNGNGRVQDFIKASRGKEIVQTDEMTKFARKMNVLAGAGTATALAGVFQPIKQTVPVSVNTLINAGKLDLLYFLDPAKVKFLNESGRGIAIRGMQSNIQVSEINKLVDLASKSTGAKAIEYIEKANSLALKLAVAKPDVYIAKASWLSYYEKGLKKQGIDPSTIDYNTHKINDQAADYAQDMVDRQQNISDADLQGKFMKSKNPVASVFTKVILPFASFRLNQTMRMYNDIKTLTSTTSSVQDKKIAGTSLSGYLAEMATFKVIATGISVLMSNITSQLMGADETDEQKEKRQNAIIRGQVTGTVTDVLSPLPPLDPFVAEGVDFVLGQLQTNVMDMSEEDRYKLMTTFKSTASKSWGVLGIAGEKISNIADAFSMATTKEFTDEYGRTKYISDDMAGSLGNIGIVSLLTLATGGPAEINSILRNSIKIAQRNSSTLEGGKEEYEKRKELKKEKRLTEEEERDRPKLDALEKMLQRERNPKKREAIQDKIDEINEPIIKTKEEREADKLERKEEKAKMEELLQGYDNKEDMKRYNPRLYEKTFGPRSKYYKENKYKDMIEKKMNSIIRTEKDKSYNYVKPTKRKKNADGSVRRSSYYMRYRQ